MKIFIRLATALLCISVLAYRIYCSNIEDALSDEVASFIAHENKLLSKYDTFYRDDIRTVTFYLEDELNKKEAMELRNFTKERFCILVANGLNARVESLNVNIVLSDNHQLVSSRSYTMSSCSE